MQLRKDGEFKKFQELLAAEMYPRTRNSMCISCNRYEVIATLTGRVDYAGKHGGFGHLNGYKVRFVLASVVGVSAIDVSARYDLSLFSPTKVWLPTAYVSGTVTGPRGEAIVNAEVVLRSPDDPPPFLHSITDWTDEHGRFKLEVPPGKYVGGVNLETPPSPDVPFLPTYFPGTEDSHSAAVLTLSDKQRLSNLNIQLKYRLTARMIPVKVVWPDGKPVADANVDLKQVNDPTAVVGGSVNHTKEDGAFDLIGFQGIDYVVHADIYVKPSYKPYCAENVIVRADDLVQETILMILNRTGDTCRDLEISAEGKPLSALK